MACHDDELEKENYGNQFFVMCVFVVNNVHVISVYAVNLTCIVEPCSSNIAERTCVLWFIQDQRKYRISINMGK